MTQALEVDGRTRRASVTSARSVLVLFACAVALTAVSAATIASPGKALSALIREQRDSTSHITVFYVFRAADRGLSSDVVAQLNMFDRSRRVRVTGVMLFPPANDSARVSLAADLGLEFRVIADAEGEWRAAIRSERWVDPQIIVVEDGAVVGSFSPRPSRILAGLGLDTIPLERRS